MNRKALINRLESTGEHDQQQQYERKTSSPLSRQSSVESDPNNNHLSKASLNKPPPPTTTTGTKFSEKSSTKLDHLPNITKMPLDFVFDRSATSLSHESDLFTPNNETTSVSSKRPKDTNSLRIKDEGTKKESGGQNIERKSSRIAVVFIFDLLLLCILIVLAVVFRFAKIFSTIEKSFQCSHFELNDFLPAPNVLFKNIDDYQLYLMVFFAPFFLIVLIELCRQLIMKILFHNTKENLIFSTNFSVSLLARRTLRIIGGFLLGFTSTSIVIDFLKWQIGELRPNFLKTCSDLANICQNSNGIIYSSNITASCSKSDVVELQTSFPSMTSSLSTYSGIFLIFYLTAALNYRALKVLRTILILIITIISFLLSASRVTSHNNHVSDTTVGAAIGALISFYIVFFYLNSFADKLSSTNYFSAKRVSANSNDNDSKNSNTADDKDLIWKSFHIPRVHQLRESARNMWRRSDQFSNQKKTTMNSNGIKPMRNESNAYINPAFEAVRENNRNHQRNSTISMENHSLQSDFRRNTNNSYHQRPHTIMQTFQ